MASVIRRRARLAVAIGLATAFLALTTARPGADSGASMPFAGAYVLAAPGVEFIGVIVFNADGTFTGFGNNEEGWPPGGPRFSGKFGAWKKTGARSMRALEFDQLYDAVTGMPLGLVRLSADITFNAGEPNRASGTFSAEFIPCSEGICPDPTEAVGWPAGSGSLMLKRIVP